MEPDRPPTEVPQFPDMHVCAVAGRAAAHLMGHGLLRDLATGISIPNAGDSQARNGNRYVYYPTVYREKAKTSAIRHLVDTFFKGSAAGAAIALLNMTDGWLSNEESELIAELIGKTRREGR